MNNDDFPILKDTARIKKMLSFCWIVDIVSDNGTKILPNEALLLSLCSGEYDLKTLKYIYTQIFRKDECDGAAIVEDTLRKLDRYIKWSIQPSDKIQRYDPKQFLYHPKSTKLTSQGRLDSPGEMVLILTHGCNFRCIYCFNDSSKTKKAVLNTNEWLDIIDQAKDLQVVKCTLSGGEPIMHPGFFDILTKLIDSDMLTYICTNGSLINRRIARKFADMRLPCIQLSLDAACAEVHDKIAAAPNTFPKVINAIKYLVDFGIDVYIKAVLTPLNIEEAGHLINMCHDLGVKRLVLDRFDLSNAGRGGTELFLTREKEHEIETLVERKQKEFDGDMSVVAVTMPRCWTRQEDVVYCGALTTSLTILPTGDISLCEKLIDVPEMIVGNLRENTIGEIWNSRQTENVLTPPMDRYDEPCQSCELIGTCRSGCYAQTLFVSDNPYAADPRCWKADFLDNPYSNQYVTERSSNG